MNPFFSIVIPLYNKEKYVLASLQSVLNQTFENYEVIIVDDCSTDESFEIVSTIKSEKVKIIKHDFNKGLSASRNTGIKNSNGVYIAFLDADDFWKHTFLEELFLLIKSFPKAKLFAANYEEVYPNNVVLLPNNNAKNLEKISMIKDFFEISLAQPLYCPSSLCVDKMVFDAIGFYNETIRYGEDVDFNIRANSSFQLAYSKKPLVAYTMVSENQITQSLIGDKIITDFDFFDTKETSKSLKKFLDFHRYIMAKHYKAENNKAAFEKMKKGITNENLNFKQHLLLNAPLLVLNWVKKTKSFFLAKGIRFSTYN
ncbi:glycosyltransferase family 2 protein [Flavobacterium sp.]|uniref:glycosyltransferase family 2 protein n=1 Tax=Flavobacterium sp. TaxID=239 RepID=UPI0025E02A4F|nr:glycosyltransferase family 2 protein [Flavobacterium sp.]